jgi:hypothetical protein
MKGPPDVLFAGQGKRIAYETAIANFVAARDFRRCLPLMPQNQGFQMGVLNAALPSAHARPEAGSALIHRVI